MESYLLLVSLLLTSTRRNNPDLVTANRHNRSASMPLMKVLKYLGAFAVAAILLLAFVSNFSSVESRFQCSGGLTADSPSRPATVYVKLERYRWWVGFWSDSDAALWLEIPNETIEYFGNVVEVEDQLQIFGVNKDLKGNFSILSKTLALSTPIGFFDGVCKAINA